MLSKIANFFERVIGLLAILSFSGVIIVVTIQIMSRFFPYSAVWTEELTRYFFLYTICFGTPIALLQNEFINVDLIFTKMTTNFRRIYEIIIYFLIIILGCVMALEGYKFTLVGHSQGAATMPIQMSLIHASILLMGVFLVIYSIVKIIEFIQNKPTFIGHGGEEL